MNENDYLSNHCWCCGVPVDIDKHFKKVPMYHVVSRGETYHQRSVSYEKIEVTVPTCERCQRFYKRISKITTLIAFLIIAGVVTVIIIQHGYKWGFPALVGVALLIIESLLMKWIRKRLLKKSGRNEIEDFPVVRALENEGWSLKEPQA